MGLVKKEIEISKEIDDVLALAQALVVGLLIEKKPIGELMASLLPALLEAGKGLEEAPKEWSEHKAAVLKALALRLSDLVEGLAKK